MPLRKSLRVKPLAYLNINIFESFHGKVTTGEIVQVKLNSYTKDLNSTIKDF